MNIQNLGCSSVLSHTEIYVRAMEGFADQLGQNSENLSVGLITPGYGNKIDFGKSLFQV